MPNHERPRPEARGAVDESRQHHPTAPDGSDQASFVGIHDGKVACLGTLPLRRGQPEGRISLAAALSALVALLPRLVAALDRQAGDRPRVEPMAYRLDELAAGLGVSRRVLERERAAGRLPKPDLYIGRMPLYRPETIRAWLERGGRP
jgi:hypothetical protein